MSSREAIQRAETAGVVLRRIGDLAVPLDPRCDICSDVAPSSAEDLGQATRLAPYPSVDSLTREFMPSAHERIVHGGGPVAVGLEGLAAIARANAPA